MRCALPSWIIEAPWRFLLLAGMLPLAAAFTAEYGFDLFPCHLCLLQRWPYAAVILFGVAAFFLRKSRGMVMICVALSTIAFMVGTGIATYHAGVELGIFEGPNACSGGTSTENLSSEDALKAILEAPLVSCGEPAALFFGLSMAAWNALLSLALTLAGMLLAWRLGNDRSTA